MKSRFFQRRRSRETTPAGTGAGFTLVEVLVSVTIFMLTLAGALALWLTYRHAWVASSLARNTSSEVSSALERIVYGVGTNSGLRAAAEADVSVTYPSGGWRIDYDGDRFLLYSSALGNITDENGFVICENVTESFMALTNQGCHIAITVSESGGGGHTSTFDMSSFVEFRN